MMHIEFKTCLSQFNRFSRSSVLSQRSFETRVPLFECQDTPRCQISTDFAQNFESER